MFCYCRLKKVEQTAMFGNSQKGFEATNKRCVMCWEERGGREGDCVLCRAGNWTGTSLERSIYHICLTGKVSCVKSLFVEIFCSAFHTWTTGWCKWETVITQQLLCVFLQQGTLCITSSLELLKASTEVHMFYNMSSGHTAHTIYFPYYGHIFA